jgi:nitrite reductase/ring-hydroxylating ferredoxin subunit
MPWIRAASLADLRDKPFVLSKPPLQIAVFRVDEKIFAIDNRCPHEGYPLAVGTVSTECVLTCNWHNWKFNLADGVCVVGGDNVRSYPTLLENGEVFVDTSPLPPEEIRRQILQGLHTAFNERDHERICREIARLHYSGFDPLEAVRAAVRWFHNHLEFGNSHAFAGAADWLTLAKSFNGDFEKVLICYSEAVDHMASDVLRQREYPYTTSGEVFDRESFLTAVEAQDAPRSEGMVARALAEGLHWEDLEEPFAAAAFLHYHNFGHNAIYVQKQGELAGILGTDMERELILPMVRRLCNGSREDLIPEFKAYAPSLATLPEISSTSSKESGIEVPFPCALSGAFQWLKRSLAVHSETIVYDALLTALARNMLHFDSEYERAFDRPVSSNVSWLDFTHGLTFSNAVRDLCTKYPHLWRPALLQMACFLGRNHPYLDETVDENEWRVQKPDAFFAKAYEDLLDHGINEPIYAVHVLKTTHAVEAELPFASADCGAALLASLNRYLHSSVKMKHVRRRARQAIALVSRDFR